MNTKKVNKKVTKQEVKPPVGLRPREISDRERMGEILEALLRYNKAGKNVPREWMEEFDELIDCDVFKERD